MFQNRGPVRFEDGFEGWRWDIMGEGGRLATTVYPVKPMWDKFSHHTLVVDGLGMVEWSLMCFCGIMPPEFWGNYAPL